MTKITYSDLKATFPEEKKNVESLYGRIFPARQLSYLLTIPLLHLNVSAFQASIISLIIAILACILIAFPNSTLRTVGVFLVPLWHVFDCVDGNIARYRHTASDFGAAVDAISGYFMFSFLSLALGIASYNIQDNYLNLSPYVFIIAGGIASISDVLMRLIHQKYAFVALTVEKNTGRCFEKGENQYTLKGFHRLRKKIDVEIGIVGIPMFVLWLCPFFNLYNILVIYYCIIKTASLFLITFYYLRKCLKEN